MDSIERTVFDALLAVLKLAAPAIADSEPIQKLIEEKAIAVAAAIQYEIDDKQRYHERSYHDREQD